MSKYFAQPYDFSAEGFYFENIEEYHDRIARSVNAHGQPVEEFEIQFIDGDDIDAALFEALRPHQGNIARFMDKADDWTEAKKRALIIVVGECGYAFDLEDGDPDDFDVVIYEMGSLRGLAEAFISDGLFGEIPESLANYIDCDAIARDLACDYAETVIAGTRLIYRCG